MLARFAVPILMMIALAGCAAQAGGVAGTSGAAAVTPVKAGTAPIVIRNDHGGNVLGNIMKRQQLAQSGRRLELRGFCDSACTMFTTLPNACLGPGATFGFHAASFTGTKIMAPGMADLMGGYYRNGIKRKWESTWSKSTKISRITAEQYVALDPEAKICK